MINKIFLTEVQKEIFYYEEQKYTDENQVNFGISKNEIDICSNEFDNIRQRRNEEYDNVNKSMHFENLKDVKQYANKIICFYLDNDPYVKYEVEKDFANKIATEQILISNAGHINSESGYDTFEDIVAITKKRHLLWL